MFDRKAVSMFWLAAGILILAACAAQPGGNQTTPEAERLANTNWSLVSYGPPESPIEVLPGTSVTLEFDAEGRAGGSGGCNSYGGDYEVENGSISFGEIVSTLMACTDPGVGEQESQFLGALQTASTYEVSGDQLTITYVDGQVLNFSRAPGN